MRVRSSLLPRLGAFGAGFLLLTSAAGAQDRAAGPDAIGAPGSNLPPVRAEGGHRAQVRRDRDGNIVLRNEYLVAVLPKESTGFGPLTLYPNPRPGTVEEEPIGVATFVGSLEAGRSASAEIRGERLVLTGTGGAPTVTLRVGEHPWIDWDIQGAAPGATVSLLAGRSGPREALFPGVFHRLGTEAPLARPVAPDPYELTVPLMAQTQDRVTVGLLWHPRLAGAARNPRALFDPAQEGPARMELSLPAAAGGATAAAQRLAGKLLVMPEAPDPAEAIRQWVEAYPLAEETDYPRSFAAERRLSREAFTQSLWSASVPGWKVWANDPTPLPYPFGVQALLMDAGLDGNRSVAAGLRQQAERVLGLLRERGPLEPRLAYRHGGVADSLSTERDRVLDLIATQLPDGSWIPAPGNRPQGTFTAPALAEAGLVAANALPVLRYAALTGDSTAAGAGRRAVEFLERLRIPGTPGREGLPAGTPELLTAAQAAECFLLAYQMNGNREYVRAARYWADTGLPFVYLWADPERAAMRYATVPVLAPREGEPPVRRASQVAGLEYARVLRALHGVRRDDLYEALSEGILASGMRQQSTSGETAGLLPEFWDVREGTGSGRMLHPWPLLELMYRIEGLNPEVSQARVRVGSDRMFVASGATIHNATTTATRLRLKMRWLPGQRTVTTVSGVPALPLRVEYNSDSVLPFGIATRHQYLPEDAPDAKEGGWTYDAESGLLTVWLPHTGDDDHLEIRWPDPRERAPVKPADRAIKPRR